MLKYKLNIKNKKDKNIEVKYESLYFSKDGSYLTGITDPSYCLSEENYVTVVSNDAVVCSLDAENVMCCGYVLLNETYKVEDFGNTVGILYNDGQYYCVEKTFKPENLLSLSDTNVSEMVEIKKNPTILIHNIEYEIGKIVDDKVIWEDSVIIPTKYWSLDNKITIHGIVYDVIIDEKTKLESDEEYFPYIILNELELSDTDRILHVIDWEYSKRHLVTKFKITNNNKAYLNINEGCCVKQFDYFDELLFNGEVVRHYAIEYENINQFLTELYDSGKQINFEWKRVDKSNIIDLYIDKNVNNIDVGAKIYVKPIGNSLTLKGEKNANNEIIFTYYNKQYVCDGKIVKKYLNINNFEYEIFKSDNSSEYVIFENRPLSISATTDGYTMVLPKYYSNDLVFNVKEYKCINIENKLYKIREIKDNNGVLKYEVDVDLIPELCLNIIYRFGDNVFRCMPNGNDDLSLLFQDITNNPNGFIFECKTPIFDMLLVSPISSSDKEYAALDFKIFVNHSSFVIPIKLESDTALNLHKDYIIRNQYDKNNLINRIVDMEKDIYYPSHLEKKGTKDVLTLCHQIKIDLHFRSRNLEDWTVNDENDINEYGGKYPSNWNIFDYYRYQIDNTETKAFQPILNLKDDLRFYPPSDLLYFLKFTDEDVFFQKKKISKSFLRLSFYDSPNPNNQSLLYTSTIFMSETDLFKKYVNADKTLTNYLTVKERGQYKEKHEPINGDVNNTNMMVSYRVDNDNSSKHISVSTEPCYDNKKNVLSFDENKRLSSSFTIKNRNECVESSDGFYLYLFKEYSNWTHERTIYMRVQFNHAGLGRTVNFMQLYHKDNEGKKSMINWASKFNFDKYKDGCPLSELYEHLFIEIKVKYDLENKRFCYYFPEWMSEKNSDKNTMHLSLFEIKIKDES